MLGSDVRRKIDETRSALLSAILAGDADASAACYTTDRVVMHPDTPYIRGRPALREYVAKLFKTLKVTRSILTPAIVAGSGNIACEVGTQELVMEPPDERFKRNRQYLFVYEEQADGSWKIAVGISGNS